MTPPRRGVSRGGVWQTPPGGGGGAPPPRGGGQRGGGRAPPPPEGGSTPPPPTGGVRVLGPPLRALYTGPKLAVRPKMWIFSKSEIR